MDMEEIGKRIHDVRIEKGLIQKDIAEKIGVAISTIQRYETGKIDKPKMPVLQAISSVLDVDPSWLIGKTSARGKYYQSSLSSQSSDLSREAIEIATAFDNAPEEIKGIIRHALSPYAQKSVTGSYSEEIAAELAPELKQIYIDTK